MPLGPAASVSLLCHARDAEMTVRKADTAVCRIDMVVMQGID